MGTLWDFSTSFDTQVSIGTVLSSLSQDISPHGGLGWGGERERGNRTEKIEQGCKRPRDLSWKTSGAGGTAWFRDDQEFCLRDTEVEWKAGIQVASLQSF